MVKQKVKPAAKPLKATPPAEVESDVKPPSLDERMLAFPIVGIGASAGGLEAFEKFFTHMPTDTGMGFVIVQHLDALHKSILSELIQRFTKMKVNQAENGSPVLPNRIYIIPPNYDLALFNGKLNLLEQVKNQGLHLPIDLFFRTLAQDQKENAIGVVLSGTGSDGTIGLKAIKGESGITLVQDPETTSYDGMPRSAIASSAVDFILPVEKMAEQIISLFKNSRRMTSTAFTAPIITPNAENMQKIFVLLRAKTGHNFSQYKVNTIQRRIEKRMTINQFETLPDYIRFLQENPLEVETLFKELLIGVTNFFRDPLAFETLNRNCISKIVSRKASDQAVRAWVPACSTGEEAYSIAMLLRDEMDQRNMDLRVQVFATDIDLEPIAFARNATYPSGISADVSPERLRKFFNYEGGFYIVKKSIRDMVVFAEHNVVDNPPFSKMDIVSCRNLLIYMEPALQKKVLPIFHYALNPEGYLFLGNSESIGDFTELFTVIDRKWKIYQRKGGIQPRYQLNDTYPSTESTGDGFAKELVAAPNIVKPNLKDWTEKSLLSRYSPAGVIVNEKGIILFIQGHTGRYLEPAQGEASMNIFRMAREDIKLPLTTLLRSAIADKKEVNQEAIHLNGNGGSKYVNIIVTPITAPRELKGLLLVVFEEVNISKNFLEIKEELPRPTKANTLQIRKLEEQLKAKEDYLQSTTEEMETSNEELKSTNEELQSSNEELQSTNEELETSREELQSVNEELITVNTELRKKIEELSQLNNDMNNLLASTEIATIFLDHSLRIQRFTPATTKIIHLISSDVGRPVTHIVSTLNYENLVADVSGVLDTLIPRDIEVQSKQGAWFLMRIMPYRTLDNVIEGAVITFSNITEQKKQSGVLNRLTAVVQSSSEAIYQLEMDGKIQAWNRAAEQFYGWNESEALKLSIFSLAPDDMKDEIQNWLDQLNKDEPSQPFETERCDRAGRKFKVLLTGSILRDPSGKPYAISCTEKKIT